MPVIADNGIRILCELLASKLDTSRCVKAIGFAELLQDSFSSGTCPLEESRQADIAEIAEAVGSEEIEFLPYSEISARIKRHRDSSVRRALMEMGRIGFRAAFFYPGAVLNGYSREWPNICIALQQIFFAENGSSDYYWYDILNIFSHYLDLLFVLKSDPEKGEELAACEKVMELLPRFVPLGQSATSFVVLCK